MGRKKKVKIEIVTSPHVVLSESTTVIPIELTGATSILPLTVDMGREDLNIVVHKINEIITKINN